MAMSGRYIGLLPWHETVGRVRICPRCNDAYVTRRDAPLCRECVEEVKEESEAAGREGWWDVEPEVAEVW